MHGVNGTNGKDGVSITKVEQTTTSTEDGGINEVIITLSNGTTSKVQIRNGNKGTGGDSAKIFVMSNVEIPEESWQAYTQNNNPNEVYLAKIALSEEFVKQNKIDVNAGMFAIVTPDEQQIMGAFLVGTNLPTYISASFDNSDVLSGIQMYIYRQGKLENNVSSFNIILFANCMQADLFDRKANA